MYEGKSEQANSIRGASAGLASMAVQHAGFGAMDAITKVPSTPTTEQALQMLEHYVGRLYEAGERQQAAMRRLGAPAYPEPDQPNSAHANRIEQSDFLSRLFMALSHMERQVALAESRANQLDAVV